MGQSQSNASPKEVSVEQAAHELALKFADKCYSHLEIAHYKDNFKTLADHQDDVEYWKEDTLCRFLSLPDSLNAGPVVYQMATYLGAFPFPALAPCILTREAMLKVITILTGRYKKVLKRGDQDKTKLLFRSMAIFDRRMSSFSAEKHEKLPADMLERHSLTSEAQSHVTGFAVDEPMNDDEEEDDDDLALAALDALDAIEVFHHDQKMEKRIHQAHVPGDNLRKLFKLILLLTPLTPQDEMATYVSPLEESRKKAVEQSADAMLAAFDPEALGNAVRYANFVRTISVSMQQLFRPLSPLFEHFLFSKNIDLSKHTKTSIVPASLTPSQRRSPIQRSSDDADSSILDDILLAQLASSIEVTSTVSSTASSIFHAGASMSVIYSSQTHGTSLSSFSRQVMSWRSPTLFLLSGTDNETGQNMVVGAFLPERWKESGSSETSGQDTSKAVMFQLRPRHAIFRANPYNKTAPISYFSPKTGIALGCVIPAHSRIQAQSQRPVPGPVSISVDEDLSTATFTHDGDAGTGTFLVDPGLEEAQRANAADSARCQAKKITIDIDALEVWGLTFAGTAEDEVARQKKQLEWEEAEAARRRGVNFGGDKDGARALLEMAGIVGEGAGNRSGGSV